MARQAAAAAGSGEFVVVVRRRNLRHQMRSCARLALTIGLFIAATCIIETGQCNAVTAPRVGDELKRLGPKASRLQRQPPLQSEYSLRNSIQETNSELRLLKRDFVQQMGDLYLGFRLDASIGYKKALDLKLSIASANILMSEQFAELLIRKHIIERRLLTGLKRFYIKMLPLPTLVNLCQRHSETFGWLRDQQQVDIRPKFRALKEEEMGNFYRLIKMRAQVRAAEDVLALTSGNIQRILQILNWYLVEGKDADKASDPIELVTLASHAKQVLMFYLDEVVGWSERLYELYETHMREWAPALAGQLEENLEESDDVKREAALVRFIDRLINVEALDIGLNLEARSLEEPPTITEQMINKLQRRWIPSYVLKSVSADRKLIVANRKRVDHLVPLSNANRELTKWAQDIHGRICESRHF